MSHWITPMLGERLSFAETMYWRLQCQPETASMFLECPLQMSMTLRFDEQLREDVVRNSFDELLQRYPVLRSTFTLRNGRIARTVLAPSESEISLRVVDLDARDVLVEQRMARAVIVREHEEPFDLSRGPLVRALLFRMGPDQSWLHVVVHHIVHDSWSRMLFEQDFRALYRVRTVSARAEGLPPPRSDYQDYVEAERRYVDDGPPQEALDYWARTFTAGGAMLRIPGDLDRNDADSEPPRSVHGVELVGVDVERLREFSKQQQATVANVAAAAFVILLHEASASVGVYMGVTANQRLAPGAGKIVGLCMNLLPVHVGFGDVSSAAAVVTRVRGAMCDAQAHGRMPYGWFIQATPGAAATAPWAVFNFMSERTNATTMSSRAETEPWRKFEGATTRCFADLTLHFVDGGQRMSGALVLHSGRFSYGLGEGLRDRYVTLLREMIADPARPLHMLRGADRTPSSAGL